MNYIKMSDVRRIALESQGMRVKPSNYYTLPKDFATASPIVYNGRLFRVITTAEAKAERPDSIRPHRITCFCLHCQRWIFAGKFLQHVRATKNHPKC